MNTKIIIIIIKNGAGVTLLPLWSCPREGKWNEKGIWKRCNSNGWIQSPLSRPNIIDQTWAFYIWPFGCLCMVCGIDGGEGGRQSDGNGEASVLRGHWSGALVLAGCISVSKGQAATTWAEWHQGGEGGSRADVVMTLHNSFHFLCGPLRKLIAHTCHKRLYPGRFRVTRID